MINITIDGLSGCGKSTTAKRVAEILGYIYIDTGAMYRAVTLAFQRTGIAYEDEAKVSELLANLEVGFRRDGGELVTLLNGEDVEDEIRTIEISMRVSEVSKLRVVREKLVEWQQKMATDKGVVMEGRDIGTVILPDAELKVFMTADLEVRARRRWEQLKSEGSTADFESVLSNLSERDKIDSTRQIAPLRKAEGAIEIDTTHLTIDKQVNKIVDLAKIIAKR